MAKGSLGEYFDGYILVKAESLNPEKIINECSKHGIVLKDIERKNYTTLIFKMRYNQYKNLKNILHKTNTKTRILKKYGIHFAYASLNRRKFFLFGSIVFLSLIIFLSNMVWNIDVKGNKRIRVQEIISVLDKSGLRTGTFKYNLNLRKIEEEVIRNIKEVSVIKINLYGTKASVEIVERTMPTKIINRDAPANIVAAKEGIITKIYSYQGMSLVKDGDLVKPNQVLISGKMSDTENELNKPVHAMGIVKAKTWYEVIKDVDINYRYTVRTGIFKQKIYYIFAGHKFYIKNNNITFKKYDKIENKNMIHLFGLDTPVEKITENYYEKIDEVKKLDVDSAYRLGITEATQNMNRILPAKAKILDIKKYKTCDKKRARVRLLYIVEENIGIEKEIK